MPCSHSASCAVMSSTHYWCFLLVSHRKPCYTQRDDVPSGIHSLKFRPSWSLSHWAATKEHKSCLKQACQPRLSKLLLVNHMTAWQWANCVPYHLQKVDPSNCVPYYLQKLDPSNGDGCFESQPFSHCMIDFSFNSLTPPYFVPWGTKWDGYPSDVLLWPLTYLEVITTWLDSILNANFQTEYKIVNLLLFFLWSFHLWYFGVHTILVKNVLSSSLAVLYGK